MFGRGIADDGRLILRALDALRDGMTDDGLQLIYMNHVAPASAVVRFRKPLSRSVTGSMNELEALAKAYLEAEAVAPFQVGFRLNATPLSVLATPDQSGYATPRQAFTHSAG
jgi:hypothetical protein